MLANKSSVADAPLLKSSGWWRRITNDKFFISSPFLIVAAAIALLLGVALSILGFYTWIIATGAFIIAAIFILRQDELAATIVIAVHLYVDWYLGLAFVAQVLTLALLLLFYLGRSPERPWVRPSAPWLWILFLMLGISPSLRGDGLIDGAYYYFNIIFNALIVFWLGLLIGRDTVSVRRLFQMLSFFGMLVAIHTIIEATTGIFLLKTTRYDAHLVAVSNYVLYGYNVHRAESFLNNPDSAGAFFAIFLFLPFALFIESSSLFKKVLYLAEMLLMLPALLFTYSTGAWIAAVAGLIAFMIFVDSISSRFLIPSFIVIIVTIMILFFPSQILIQWQHATKPDEWVLRIGGWETAIRIIQALPLTGLGMGRNTYIERAEYYRVPQQFVPDYHPHNSYLELAALGGIQVSIVFLALLVVAFWQALRNWAQADTRSRSLLAGGLASIIAMCVHSIDNAGWTLVPFVAIGWLIIGVLSSPLLMKGKKAANVEDLTLKII